MSVPPGSTTCGSCGHGLSRSAPSSLTDVNACQSCASLLAADARFCSSCGDPAETAPPAVPSQPAAPHPLAAFGPSGAPPPGAAADESIGSRPPVVPQPRVAPAAPMATGTPAALPAPAPPPPPEAPKGPGFVTYNALPASTPPLDTSVLLSSHLQAPSPAPEPEVPPAPPPPPVAEIPPTPPPQAPTPPRPPKPPREPLSPGLIVAGVVTAVLLIGGGAAALLLSGRDEPNRAAALSTPAASEPESTTRPTPTRAAPTRSNPNLRRQVLALDDLMKQSQAGRAAAAKGDTKTAIANRSDLLKDAQRLRGQARDAKLKAGLGSFVAAIRESLRQNRECADGCPAGDLEKVNGLKRETVGALNPLLRKYAKTTYRARDI